MSEAGDKDKSSEALACVEPESVRERLTLHVRKRLSGELQVVVKQETKPAVSCKKSKKKSKSPKQVRIKQEEEQTEQELRDSPEQAACSDDANSRHQSPVLDDSEAQAARESFLNNAILSEILNDKKKALFESEEILELLRERMSQTSHPALTT